MTGFYTYPAPAPVYAVVNPMLNVRVLVGDSLEIRDRLVADVAKGQLLPAVAILPVLALLIWLSVAQGLGPLNRIASSIAGRSAEELHPIDEAKAPSEIKPLLTSLNSLFRRVEQARDREKTFIAYAAHELKTPLAGLKTQAQVTLHSHDNDVRSKALSQISRSVDRTGRLVRQLIDMAMKKLGGELSFKKVPDGYVVVLGIKLESTRDGQA